MLGIEASLKRLNTDRLDLYFIHGFDANTPIDETLRALDDLVHAGKILYPAVSNWAAWQIAKALGVSNCAGLARFECIQPMYNLVKRQVEVEILPLAQAEQIGVISYSPLGGGLLTGKFGAGRKPESGRLLENPVYVKRYGDANTTKLPIALRCMLRARPSSCDAGSGLGDVASSDHCSHHRGAQPRTTGTLTGCGRPGMTPEWRAEISALSQEPPPATDRSEEKSGLAYGGGQAEIGRPHSAEFSGAPSNAGSGSRKRPSGMT